MIKYVDNSKMYIKLNHAGLFFISTELNRKMDKPSYIKLLKSKDGCYIKIKPCDALDIDSNTIIRPKSITKKRKCEDSAIFSSCEFRAQLSDKEPMYAYGIDVDGDVIIRIKETEHTPSNFSIIKKETKLFIANGGHRHGIRLSMELYRRLNKPKRVSVYISKRKQRMYIKRAVKSVGTYPVSFTKTSVNSGFAQFSALNLYQKFGIEIDKRIKYEAKYDELDRIYIDISTHTLPKNSKGLQ